MKKKILSQLMILSFAFADLFLVGNNVFGNGGTIGDLDDTPIAIRCHQFPGHEARCWIFSPIAGECVWTGNQAHVCIIL